MKFSENRRENSRFKPSLAAFFIGVVCLYMVILGFTLHGLYDEIKMNNELSIGAIEVSDYLQCNNLSLVNTSICLRNYISDFYNYTIRSDEIRTIEDIKENGGDCYDYNKLYERLGKELGFETYSFRIYIGETSHRVAIISDEGGYCVLDQRNKPRCNSLGGNNEE